MLKSADGVTDEPEGRKAYGRGHLPHLAVFAFAAGVLSIHVVGMLARKRMGGVRSQGAT